MVFMGMASEERSHQERLVESVSIWQDL